MSDFIPGLGVVSQVVVVVAAFSALIFVHELGHYLAAVLTGVRVERFFIGFDVFGLALKKECKGTVYGIGILPLGGYCALAGQNDDPRKERQTGAPDELQSKPLWARALVFGGGVVMNFIFGFLVLVAAYMYGIPFIPAALGALDPTGPAAVHGLKPGDRILSVDGKPVESFEEAAEAIALSGAGGEVEIEVSRALPDAPVEREKLAFRVKGRASSLRGNLNTIGAEPARSRIIAGIVDDPAFDRSLKGKLAAGDEILAVNGVELPENMGHLLPGMLENKPGGMVDLTIRDGRDDTVRDVRAPLETYGEWDMGMRVGVSILNVMRDGPADRAGFRKGDLVVACQRPRDDEPLRFAKVKDFQDIVNESALRCVKVNFTRDGKELAALVTPRFLINSADVDPETDTLLGVIGVMEGDSGFRVDRVVPESPSDGIMSAGDYLTGLNDKPLPVGMSLREMVEDASSEKVRYYIRRESENGGARAPFEGVVDANLLVELAPRILEEYRRPMIGVDLAQGPVVAVEPGSFADRELGGLQTLQGGRLAMIQYSPDLASVTIGLAFPDGKGGNAVKRLTADTPESIVDAPLAAGLRSRLPVSLKTAEEVIPLSFAPAVAAAGRKWVDLSLMVYRVIHKLIVRTLPLDAIGGPVQLFRIIKIADDRGFAYFLYIVALISVNLGVCNLLPFPVLDGGHLVFLLIEWLIGRPPPLAVREAAQWVGIVCLLTLMLTVTGFDIFYLFTGAG
ncbi:MAG: site-2 protease family protein [Planctomycetota bacterium]|jgi:membrane-associated protease RseP (regulator of RpoE activity)|nr:site-2 protease family protein [Planctomycetota bacterium]